MRVLLALSLTAAATVASTEEMTHSQVYRAEIVEIPGTDSGVTGVAYVFTAGDGTTVGYAGVASGAQPLLLASTCNATNGCGVHIHSGTSCADKDGQGGHFFETREQDVVDDSPVAAQQDNNETTVINNPDPWVDARYSSNENGEAKFSGVLAIGSNDVEGRAFVFHNEDGSRAGCGLLMKVSEDELLSAEPTPLGEKSVSGQVVSHPVDTGSDHICFFAQATGMEPNLISDQQDPISTDCTSKNGCGLHYHSGTGCENSTTQGGHLYDETVVLEDPWLTIGYLSTDASGNAYHADCVVTGVTDYVGRAFVFHASNGDRVACGIVEQAATHDHDHGDGGIDDKGNDESMDDQTSATSSPRNLISFSMMLLFSLVGLMV